MSLIPLSRLLVIVAFLCACLVPQTGAFADDWDDCEKKINSQPNVAISGCTAIINDGDYKKEDMADAYYYRGTAYSKNEDYNSAISDFTQAITLIPGDADAYNRRGIAYRKKGDLDGAIADYNRAIKLDPSHPNAFKNREKALRMKGGSSGGTAPPVRRAAREGNLAYDLQEELKYIGCYTGGLDGVWGRGSESALRRFCDAGGTCLNHNQPTQEALEAARKENKGFCKPVRKTPKRKKPNKYSCGKNGQYNEEIPGCECFNGFFWNGSRCAAKQAGGAPPSSVKKKKRCSAIKFAFTRGNTCACSGGRIFTGSSCVKPRQSGGGSGQTCTPGQTRKANNCRFQCECTGLVTCNWVVEVCE